VWRRKKKIKKKEVGKENERKEEKKGNLISPSSLFGLCFPCHRLHRETRNRFATLSSAP
jgi:cytochrome c2